MKTTIKNLATAVLAIALTSTQLLANTTGVHLTVLTEADWTEIEETATLDAMLEIDEFPATFIETESALTTEEWAKIEQQTELESMLDIQELYVICNSSTRVLSANEWNEIKDQAELDAMLDF